MTTNNFAMYAGDSKTLRVTVLDEDGEPVSIAGATIKWSAARGYGKEPAIEKTTSSGISIVSASGGIFDVALDPEDTEEINGGFQHEAEVTFGSGIISTVMTGTMTVRKVLITAT